MSAASQIDQPRPGTAIIDRTNQYTARQLYNTLRLCLRYWADDNGIFNQVIKGLSNIYFIPMLYTLSEPELSRLIPMLKEKLTSLRLQVSDIPKLQAIFRKSGILQLVNTRYCELVAEKDSKTAAGKHIELLSELLPNLEILHVSCSIEGHFPILEKVHTLYLGNASQATLDDLLHKCPQLKHFELSGKNDSTSLYDLQNIALCKLIKNLLLPLEVKSSLAICHLVNLSQLSLQCKKLWAESTWLPIVLTIIQAKRFSLERLTFDGTWLVGPLIVSKLQLAQCTALKELRVSNCKVIDGVGYPLPLICQQLSFRRCTLNRLHRFLATQQMLSHLSLFECQVEWSGSLLRYLLGVSKRRLGLVPLRLYFSQSTRLRSEYTNWENKDQEAATPWLQVREVESATWKQPLGMITMEFGRPIDNIPEYQLPLESVPVAAEILKDLGSI